MGFVWRRSGLLLLVLGLALADGGTFPLFHDWNTDTLVKAGLGVRNGGLVLPRPQLLATAQALATTTTRFRTADDAGALTFLDYAAGRESLLLRDGAAGREELAAARAMAIETLRAEPTRADVSLALAEIDYMTGVPRDEVERFLLLSYRTAPRELWIVERRIGLGLLLVGTTNDELRDYIVSDIRIMGQPFHDTSLYRELAEAAARGGPKAIALVRQELAAINDQPLQAFNQDLASLGTGSAPQP